MKKHLLLKFFVAVFIAAGLINCSDEESTLNISSIELTTVTTVVRGAEVTLTAVNQDGVDITGEVQFVVADVEIIGNTFTADEAGNISVLAKYETISSNVRVILVVENISSIVLTTDRTSIKPTNRDIAQFSAVNQSGQDITSAVEFFKDGKSFAMDSFVVAEFGTFQFTAEFESITSNAITITSELNVTSLTLTADRATIPANGGTSPVFYILDQDADTITNFSSVFYNGTELVNQVFNTSAIGAYDFVAKYEEIESNSISISSVAKRSNRKVLIEEFTGEWCGWCPQAAYNLDLLVQSNDKVLTVGIHNGDDLEYANESTIRDAFGLGYFPSGLVGRVNLGPNVGYNDEVLNSAVTDEVDRQLNNEEILGAVSINTSMSGTDALVDVSLEFYTDIQEEVMVTIYLIENDVVSGTQENYFSGYAEAPDAYYFSQPPSIPGYVHQYVLRRVATDVNGELIPSSKTTNGTSYSVPTKTIDVSSYNTNKCAVIAFIHFPLDGSNRTIINAQQVTLGSDVGFED